MDSIGRMDPGLNPMSSKFHSTAIQNMQTNIASVKNNKELEESETDPHDLAMISVGMNDAATVTHEEAMVAASYSGELAEAQDELVKDGDEQVNERRVGEEAERELASQQGANMRPEQHVDGNRRAEQIDGVDLDAARLRDVRADVPDEIFEAATQIVRGQIVSDTKPAQSLTQLKNVDGVGMIETGKEDFVGLMDIHDTGNQPLPLDLEEVQA